MVGLGQALIFVAVAVELAVIAALVGAFFTVKRRTRKAMVRCRAHPGAAGHPGSFREPDRG